MFRVMTNIRPLHSIGDQGKNKEYILKRPVSHTMCVLAPRVLLLRLIHCALNPYLQVQEDERNAEGFHTFFPNLSILETSTSFSMKEFA